MAQEIGDLMNEISKVRKELQEVRGLMETGFKEVKRLMEVKTDSLRQKQEENMAKTCEVKLALDESRDEEEAERVWDKHERVFILTFHPYFSSSLVRGKENENPNISPGLFIETHARSDKDLGPAFS